MTAPVCVNKVQCLHLDQIGSQTPSSRHVSLPYFAGYGDCHHQSSCQFEEKRSNLDQSGPKGHFCKNLQHVYLLYTKRRCYLPLIHYSFMSTSAKQIDQRPFSEINKEDATIISLSSLPLLLGFVRRSDTLQRQ